MVTSQLKMKLFDDLEQATVHIRVMPKAVPFVKWAGGKRRLIKTIVATTPAKFKRYLEPFVGGGAVALALGYHPMLLNDANTELINTYRAIRDNLDELIVLLDQHQAAHSETYFYTQRKLCVDSLSPLEQAARFIYLNKTCFNGLYRVNKFGQFNVPFGRYTNPILYDLNNLRAVAKVLAHAELFDQDYQSFLQQQARPGDFIYLDPPYVPVGKYSDFKRYTKEQFRENDQYILAKLYRELVELGAYPVLSNSYSELSLELYKDFEVQVVYMGRNINQDGNGRGLVPEIIVRPRQAYEL
jgi:DNA adenine methylase